MAPIRLAIIGLSQSAKTSWASSAHLPYLLSDRGRERYKIVALLNSSAESARKAIETYGLSVDVKAYGQPEALASDPDIDLVACSTRVDVHYDTIRPSIEAGKNVFVEWPLAENKQRASELAEAAKRSGSRTLVGIQGRVSPAMFKVKEVLQDGLIGKVLSSDVTAFTPGGGGYDISEGLAYFMDKKVGGNPVTIAFAHMMDPIHSVLGEYESCNAQTQIQRPNQNIVNRETGAERSTTSDVPDLVSVHGSLKTSDIVTAGALLSVNFRTGPPFPGTMPFVWTITGQKGRIRVTNERGAVLNAHGSEFAIPIQWEDFATGEVKEIPWEWESWQEALPGRGRNLAKIYDLYSEGRAEEAGVVDFAAAVRRHTQIDALLY